MRIFGSYVIWQLKVTQRIRHRKIKTLQVDLKNYTTNSGQKSGNIRSEFSVYDNWKLYVKLYISDE